MTSPQHLLRNYHLHAKKPLGQNFLSDPSIAEMIVSRSGITASDVVLEIGPGLGALTFPVSRQVHAVFAIEKDSQMAAVLRELISENPSLFPITLIENDILKEDIRRIAALAGQPLVVMGNLPYNISSQVLIQLIHNRDCISRAVLMFQKELAERIIAGPGSKDYGRITVMLQYCAEVRHVASIASHMFFPKPKVDSAVVEICFKTPTYPADDEIFFSRVVQAAFGKRRKTLKNALSSSGLDITPHVAEDALNKVSIEPSRRAETLSIAEFVSLSNCLLKKYREISNAI